MKRKGAQAGVEIGGTGAVVVFARTRGADGSRSAGVATTVVSAWVAALIIGIARRMSSHSTHNVTRGDIHTNRLRLT